MCVFLVSVSHRQGQRHHHTGLPSRVMCATTTTNGDNTDGAVVWWEGEGGGGIVFVICGNDKGTLEKECVVG